MAGSYRLATEMKMIVTSQGLVDLIPFRFFSHTSPVRDSIHGLMPGRCSGLTPISEKTRFRSVVTITLILNSKAGCRVRAMFS